MDYGVTVTPSSTLRWREKEDPLLLDMFSADIEPLKSPCRHHIRRRRRDCQGPDTHSEYDGIRNYGGIKSRANSSLLVAPIKNGEIDDVLLLR
ncbi:hypothetical protein AVEN_10257-1 [Araneus ventricosus]|uniref:Uncharacterized protein n=1 Tax=Araneus ventricosus TaxID=182803 RepID=A0A4Y1ZUS4_ARAVE|nr:hypothetical protein AVEN_10257-1 [Araneus ventricosus]